MASNRDRNEGHRATSGSEARIHVCSVRPERTRARPEASEQSKMNTRSDLKARRRELAHRSANGVEVTLDWMPATNTLSVAVYDRRTGDAFELLVAPDEDPLHVFHHPYAHAAWKGIDYWAAESQAA
jgi:hypothetical protein